MSTDITFEQIGEFEYQVTNNEEGEYFIGELDDALDIYSSWTSGNEPPFELDWFVDIEEGMEIIIELEEDEDDED